MIKIFRLLPDLKEAVKRLQITFMLSVCGFLRVGYAWCENSSPWPCASHSFSGASIHRAPSPARFCFQIPQTCSLKSEPRQLLLHD